MPTYIITGNGLLFKSLRKRICTIGYGPLATKRHFFLVVAIYTNSVHTDYSIKTYKTAILKFSMVPIKKCYLTKLYKIKIVTNL